MIRIYEGFIKPETCILPTKIIQSKEKVTPSDDVDVMDVNGTAVDKGPGYAVEVEMPRQSYCVKIIGSTSKVVQVYDDNRETFQISLF